MLSESTLRWLMLILFVICPLACQGSEVASQDVLVPFGIEPVIDGTIASDEWADALVLPMEPIGEMLLQADADYLYLAIRADGLPVTNIYALYDERVNVLHVSAALGSAIYELLEDSWIQVDSYLPYTCRSTLPSTVSSYSKRQRDTHFESEGWYASIVFMGARTDVEYQIPWGEETLPLAVISLLGDTFEDQKAWLPADLNDGCWNRTLLNADDVSPLQFNPSTWLQLRREMSNG